MISESDPDATRSNDSAIWYEGQNQKVALNSQVQDLLMKLDDLLKVAIQGQSAASKG